MNYMIYMSDTSTDWISLPMTSGKSGATYHRNAANQSASITKNLLGQMAPAMVALCIVCVVIRRLVLAVGGEKND